MSPPLPMILPLYAKLVVIAATDILSQIRSSRYGLCILAIVVINAEEHNDHVSDNAQN